MASLSSSGARTHPGSADVWYMRPWEGENPVTKWKDSSLVAHQDPIKALVGISHWEQPQKEKRLMEIAKLSQAHVVQGRCL